MTGRKLKAVRPRIEALVAQDRDLLKTLVKETLEARQVEMTEGKGSARRSPAGRPNPVGASSCSLSRSAGWRELSSSYRMTMSD
jgi:hypothetical protein